MIINDKQIIEQAIEEVIANSPVKGEYTLQDAKAVHTAINQSIKQMIKNKDIIDFGPFVIKPNITHLKYLIRKSKRYLYNKAKNEAITDHFFDI